MAGIKAEYLELEDIMFRSMTEICLDMPSSFQFICNEISPELPRIAQLYIHDYDDEEICSDIKGQCAPRAHGEHREQPPPPPPPGTRAGRGVCTCVCVCARARVRVCVGVCVCWGRGRGADLASPAAVEMPVLAFAARRPPCAA